MSDQFSSDKVRAILNNRAMRDDEKIAEIKAMLPAPVPALPTLADMTDKDREACRFMYADVEMTPEERPTCWWTHTDLKNNGSHVVILDHHEKYGLARVLWPCGCTKPVAWEKVTPRPDRVHMEWPDTEKPAPAAPVKVGDVIESADDPRLDALPVGTVLADRDWETVAKRSEAWDGPGYSPIESEGDEFGPWTVRRVGRGAGQ